MVERDKKEPYTPPCPSWERQKGIVGYFYLTGLSFES
jgi:hypothetical protein